MSNLVLSNQWNSNINKVDVVEPILGGDGGNANIATRQLAENVFFIKGMIDEDQDRLADHESAADPHVGYLLKDDFFKRFQELEARVLLLEGGSSLATPTAIYAATVAGYKETKKNDSYLTVTVTEQTGLIISIDSESENQSMSLNSGQPRDYVFIFNLPPEYDPALNRIVVNGGSSYTINESDKTVTIRQSSTGSKKWSSFDGGYWQYKAYLNGNFRIEMYDKESA